MTMFFLALTLTVFLAFPESDLLLLDETVALDPDIVPGDEVEQLLEASELVFTVKSITRRISILGWASERYDIEIGRELKGDLPENTVFMYTFPCGLYSSQFSSLTEAAGLIVYASMPASRESMEGLHSTMGTWSVYLHIPISE